MFARPHRTLHGLIVAMVMASTAMASAQTILPASPITPYLDSQTVLVARLSLEGIDANAANDALKALGARLKAAQVDPAISTPLLMSLHAAMAKIAAAKRVGIDRVYLLVPRLGLFHDPQAAVAIFVALGPNADAAGALQEVQRDVSGTNFVSQALSDRFILLATPETLALYAKPHPEPRPDLESPLAASQAAFDLVVAPTADTRRVIAEMMPQLPAPLNTQSTDFISRDLIDIHLQIQLPPSTSVLLRADTRTHDAAQTLVALAQRGLPLLRADPDVLSGSGLTPGANGGTSSVEAVFQRLTPAVEGAGDHSAAVLKLNADALNQLFDAAIPVVERARHEAVEVASASNLRQIAVAYIMYLDNHKNAPPPSLDALVDPQYLGAAQVLINPADPEHRRYILIPWTAAQIAAAIGKTPSSTPIAYEDVDLKLPINVAFLDGHVERIGTTDNLRIVMAGVPGVTLPAATAAATQPAR